MNGNWTVSWRKRLGTRIAGSLVITSVLLVAIVALVLGGQTQRELTQSGKDMARSVAHLFASSVRVSVLLEEKEMTQDILAQHSSVVSDLVFVKVFDAKDELMGAWFAAAYSEEGAVAALGGDELFASEAAIPGDEDEGLATAGSVHVGISKHTLHTAMERVVGIAMFIILCAALGTLLVGTVLARRITKPILSMVGVAERISNGEILGTSVEVRSTDEVGRLEEAMQRMLRNLRQLTEQAQTIANDDLQSPLLQQKLAGDLGEAYAEMTAKLSNLGERASAIAAGDLDAAVLEHGDSSGSLGGAFATMVVNLRSQMTMLNNTAQGVKASAAEILAVAKETETNAADEASAVDQTRRTMESLLSAADEIANGARSVFDSAQRSAEASLVTGQRIAALNAQATKITDISDSIRTIADKSEILALNASLEGTKAGDAGRGFVLVGAEMRRLAETVMQAVREVKQLAAEIQDIAQAAVRATEDGQRLAEETADTSQRITLTTGQQQSGTEQVSRSMDEIQLFTRQALSGAQEARATADDLLRSAEELTLIIGSGRDAPSSNA